MPAHLEYAIANSLQVTEDAALNLVQLAGQRISIDLSFRLQSQAVISGSGLIEYMDQS